MKIILIILFIFFDVLFVSAQASSSVVDVLTVYSQNENFYLKSTPYDDEFPTLRGKTSVYQKGSATPIYEFERGFDSVDNDSNNLILSNDGEIIFFVISWDADDEKEGLKSVTIYKNGKIAKSFTKAEITGCDYEKERCDLIYSNYAEVVDKTKSKWGTRNYKKAFKDGVGEKEIFLSDFPLFNSSDKVYLTDSKKKVHIFDLENTENFSTENFDDIFDQIKSKGRFNKTERQRYDSAIFPEYPKLKSGEDTKQALAKFLGMKVVDDTGEKDEQFKWYRFKINTAILQNGAVEIEELELFDELPKEKIIEFFKTNKFDSSSVQKVFEKWNIGDKYFEFRKSDDKLARKEKRQDVILQREELAKQMTAEKIGDIYIPKNLEECFIELDKLLKDVDKKEMQSLPKRDEMIKHHHGLGMWMRNNWRLWGGSRLQKYFTDKGIAHPEDMSSVVLFYYYDWLNGKKDAWKNWEANPKEIYGK